MTWLDEIKKALSENPGKSVGDIMPIARKRWNEKKAKGLVPVAKKSKTMKKKVKRSRKTKPSKKAKKSKRSKKGKRSKKVKRSMKKSKRGGECNACDSNNVQPVAV